MSRIAFHFLAAVGLSIGYLYHVSPATDDKVDEGFQDLFNGKDFTGWKMFLPGDADPEKTGPSKTARSSAPGIPTAISTPRSRTRITSFATTGNT